MIKLNDRIVPAVYNVARYAPTAPRDRNQYCAFFGGIVRRIQRDTDCPKVRGAPAG
jgi:hypothetical protein